MFISQCADHSSRVLFVYLEFLSPMDQRAARDLHIFLLPFFASFESDFDRQEEKTGENAAGDEQKNA